MRSQDHEKTEASIESVLAILLGAEDKTADTEQVTLEASRALRARLGAGWTYLSAIQWLTGKRAWAVVQALNESDRIGGLTAKQAQVLIGFSSEFCQAFNLSAGAAAALDRIRAAGKIEA